MHGSTHPNTHPDAEAALLARIERAQAHMAKPTAAQRNAQALRELGQPRRDFRAPTEAEREIIQRHCRDLTNKSTAHAQWAGLDLPLRRLLVVYAGLRDKSPGESLTSIAGREWSEFIPAEHSAITEAVRALLRRLAQQTELTKKVRV